MDIHPHRKAAPDQCTHTPAGYTPCPLISGCDTQGKLRNDGSRNNHPHQRFGKKKRHYSKDITLLHKGVTS